MCRKRKLWIAGLVILCALVLLAVWLAEQKNEVDPFQTMKTAAVTRIERKTDGETQSCVCDQYELSLNSAVPGLNIKPVQKKIDETEWNYRITFNYLLDEDDPERIICLIGDEWIQIGEVVYDFEYAEQWETFEEFLCQTFDGCVDKYGLE